MITSISNGNAIVFNEESNNWVYPDEIKLDRDRPCPKCGQFSTENGHDHCLANLPGVKNACCGHGVEEGYINFENGITIRGYFKVERPVDLKVKKYNLSFYDDDQSYNLSFSLDIWKKIIKSIKTSIPDIEELS